MKIQIHEEKNEPPVELQRTTKIVLTQEEYSNGVSVDLPS